MNNFNVNISVNDCCISKCCTNNICTTKIISIENSNIFFVRRAFIGIPIKIRIPNNCSCHIVTILVNSITT